MMTHQMQSWLVKISLHKTAGTSFHGKNLLTSCSLSWMSKQDASGMQCHTPTLCALDPPTLSAPSGQKTDGKGMKGGDQAPTLLVSHYANIEHYMKAVHVACRQD